MKIYVKLKEHTKYMEKTKLSVVIPAYNEEKRITKTLKAIDLYLKNQNYSYEILVVDDGSKDNTVDVTRSLVSEIQNLRVTGYKKNKGKGYAVRFGMLEARGEYRLLTDADNSTSIDHIEKMWPEFDRGYDAIIASRDIEGAVLDPPQPHTRVLTGDIFKLLRKIIVGLWELEDTQCGFKVFSAKCVEEVFIKGKIDRFAFDPEILILTKKAGYKIKEIPIFWKNDLNSKVKFKSMIKMLIDLFRIRLNLILRIYG